MRKTFAFITLTPLALVVTLWLAGAFTAVFFPPFFMSQIAPFCIAYALGAWFVMRFALRRLDPKSPKDPGEFSRVVMGATLMVVVIAVLVMALAVMGYISTLEAVVFKMLMEVAGFALIRRFW